MEEFTVPINFSTNVSAEAADKLDDLVQEFVQGLLIAGANDEMNQTAAMIRNTIWQPDEGSDAPVANDEYGTTDFDRR